MNKLQLSIFSAALTAFGMGMASATIVTFGFNPVPANNTDLSPTFASNAAADGNGWTTSNGTTPNIALTWAPTGGSEAANNPDSNVLEIHAGAGFQHANYTAIGAVVPVLQFDMDQEANRTGAPADPTIRFDVTGGFALKLNSLQLINANDQPTSEAAYIWTVTLTQVSNSQLVATKTTQAMSATSTAILDFDFTGLPNESYILRFDDGGANRVRTALDNLSFNQVMVPEASSLSLAGLAMLGLLRRSRKS